MEVVIATSTGLNTVPMTTRMVILPSKFRGEVSEVGEVLCPVLQCRGPEFLTVLLSSEENENLKKTPRILLGFCSTAEG